MHRSRTFSADTRIGVCVLIDLSLVIVRQKRTHRDNCKIHQNNDALLFVRQCYRSDKYHTCIFYPCNKKRSKVASIVYGSAIMDRTSAIRWSVLCVPRIDVIIMLNFLLIYSPSRGHVRARVSKSIVGLRIDKREMWATQQIQKFLNKYTLCPLER